MCNRYAKVAVQPRRRGPAPVYRRSGSSRAAFDACLESRSRGGITVEPPPVDQNPSSRALLL